ncbi:MAG: hypothetical protein Q7S04_03255 [Candidatus Moranbacteria bacterium]|nr:hypothetical protein [Candidatus Moranbacteria bacterium]
MHTQKKKKIIGIDLDDVLLDFNPTLYAWHNATYGTSFEHKDVTSYFIEDIWKCTRAEAVAKIVDFYLTDEHKNALPVSGAVQGIERLRKNHSLILVTSKPDYLRPLTVKWLEKHFPAMFQSIHFTNHWLGDKNKRRTKSELCRRLGIQVFVEDGPAHALDVATVCEQVFLFNRPWNQMEVFPPIVRVSSWEDIVQKLQ